MNLTGQEDVLLTLSLLAATVVHDLTLSRWQALKANQKSLEKVFWIAILATNGKQKLCF